MASGGGRDAEFDVIANDKTAKGITSAANRFDRLSRHIKDKTDDWAKYGDTAGKRFAGKAAQAMGAVVGAAAKVGKGVMGAVSSAVSASGPLVKGALVAVLAAAAAAAAPVIATAITAGVLLGVGGGVLAGGIALAAGSPKVKKAGENLKNRFLDIDTGDLEANYAAAQERMSTAVGKEAKKRAKVELAEAKGALNKANAYNKKNFSLKDAAAPFIAPLTRALETFQASASKVIPQFAGMFKDMAPVIDKIVPALVLMATNALPGIASAAAASKPLFDALAQVLPKLGTQIGLFFKIIADGSPQSAQMIKDIVGFIGNLIVGLATVIRWLTTLYSWARTVWIGVGEFIKAAIRVGLNALGMLIEGAAKAFGWIPGLGPKLRGAAEEFKKFRDKANNFLDGIQDEAVTVKVAMNVTGNASSSAVANALRKQNATSVLSAGVGFAGAADDGYRSRTGGPTPVAVNQTLNVSLDGVPFYAMVATAMSAAERRQAWHARNPRRP